MKRELQDLRSHEYLVAEVDRLKARLVAAERKIDLMREWGNQHARGADQEHARAETAERERDEAVSVLAEAREALAHLVWLVEDFERKLTDSDLDAARAALAARPEEQQG